MRVGPAVAEAVHRRVCGSSHVRVRLDLGRDTDLQLVERDFRVELVEDDLRRDGPPLHGERGLDQTRDTRRGLGMAEVVLDRADHQRLPAAGNLAVRVPQCLRLQRVAHAGTGAMRLDVSHQGRVDARLLDHAIRKPLLRHRIWHGQRYRPAVLVDPAATNHRIYMVTVALRLLEVLEHHDSDALTTAVAVRCRVERLAATVGREESALTHGDERFRLEHDVHSAGKRHIALATRDRPYRQVRGDQRGRTCRVHGHARPPEVERVGDSVGQQRLRRAEGGEVVDLLEVSGQAPADHVVIHEAADEGSHVPAQRLSGDARVVEGFPGGFEKKPLLWVQDGSLTVRDPEEIRIEPSETLGQEATAPRVHPARRIGVRVVVLIRVPAILRNINDGVALA